MDYSPKKIWKNYFAFYWNTIAKNPSGIFVLAIALAVPVIYYLLRIAISDEPGFFNYVDYNTARKVLFGSVAFTISSMFLGSIFMWQMKFTIRDGQLTDFFPKLKSFRIDEIDYINLVSPHNAHIYIKHQNDNIFTVCYWFGRDEADWNHFIGLLLATTPSIADRIYVKNHKYKNSQFVKSSPKDSYPAIQKVFGKKLPSSNEASKRISDTDA